MKEFFFIVLFTTGHYIEQLVLKRAFLYLASYDEYMNKISYICNKEATFVMEGTNSLVQYLTHIQCLIPL